MNPAPCPAAEAAASAARSSRSLLTAEVAGQVFGLPIGRVRDIFAVGDVTPVPLAPPHILGLLALRGRIVTLLGIRPLLGLPASEARPGDLAIGIEAGTDVFALAVERVGEIVEVESGSLEPLPVHLHASWSGVSGGSHRLSSGFVVAIDIEKLLHFNPSGPSPRDAPRRTLS